MSENHRGFVINGVATRSRCFDPAASDSITLGVAVPEAAAWGQQPSGPGILDDFTGSTVGRFRVHERLGFGGMGEVYRADDTKLKRPVALKRLAPELRDDPEYRHRFFKEAERAARLTHQCIAGLYDVLEVDGEVFLVMEYVDGHTLLKASDKPLTVVQFLDIAMQCAEALEAAHEQRIVHRDVKPSNIMVTHSGQVKILDFGVARRLPGPLGETSTASTAFTRGSVFGTPSYMAPEVLLGYDADQRSDLFSLGIVFYEALAGRHPFLAETFAATSNRILHEEPVPVGHFNATVPIELERVVEKMLTKSPDERHATAADVLADLRTVRHHTTSPVGPQAAPAIPRPRRWRRFALGAAVMAIVVATVVAAPPARRVVRGLLGIGALPTEKTVAILSFEVDPADAELGAFSAGLSEVLTGKLTRMTDRHPLSVVPAGEVDARRVSTLDGARESLGANLAVQGTLERAGSAFRATVTVSDTAAGRVLRSAEVEATFDDPFSLENRLFDAVLAMLEVSEDPAEHRAHTAFGTDSATAYELYVRGCGYLRDGDLSSGADRAAASFDQARILDVRWAAPHVGLGTALWRRYDATRDPGSLEGAIAACRSAVDLGPEAAAANRCLATIYLATGQDVEAAREFDRSLHLEPTSDDAIRGSAWAYDRLGAFEQAEDVYRRAIQLRPAYWRLYSLFAGLHYDRGEFEQAADMFEKALERAPAVLRTYSNLGVLRMQLGDYEGASRAFRGSNAIEPSAAAYNGVGVSFFLLGQFDQAIETLDTAIGLGLDDYLLWGNMADAFYYSPGEQEAARSHYRQAVGLAELRRDPTDEDARLLADLADYYAKLNEWEEAEELLEIALSLEPDDRDVLYKAAIVHHLSGRDVEALDWLGQALAAGFSPHWVRDTIEFAQLRGTTEFQQMMDRY